jgi:MFS transporter, FSR family, fosmidomycin resistance protein
MVQPVQQENSVGPGTPRPSRRLIRLSAFVLVLLAIEFLDELVFGAREAAWPLIRTDLGLDYGQVGLLLGVPNVVSAIVEPAVGIMGDQGKRRAIVVVGGLCYALGLLLVVLSGDFLLMMLALVVLYPASGSFVSLSQAALMDTDPSRHEHNMARWTFAGSLGVVAGTLLVGAVSALDPNGGHGAGWRSLFGLMAGLALALVFIVSRFRFPAVRPDDEPAPGFIEGLVGALKALRRREVLHWLVLLAFGDLMVDILLGFLTLYFVDVAHTTEGVAALGATVWMSVGLVGDFLLIPLLERVPGLRYLRFSALVELLLFPAFLLVPDLWAKFVLLAFLGLFNAGWYSILKAQLYSSMPGQSGRAVAVYSMFSLVSGSVPAAVGFAAKAIGLQSAMWLMLLGPVALLVGLGKVKRKT